MTSIGCCGAGGRAAIGHITSRRGAPNAHAIRKETRGAKTRRAEARHGELGVGLKGSPKLGTRDGSCLPTVEDGCTRERISGVKRQSGAAHVDGRASVVIASAGPAMADVVETKYGEIRSRSGAQLRFTVNDAEAIYDKWKAHGGSLGDDFHVLLVDPTLRQVEEAIRRMSNRIADCHADAALDLCFAGHGLAGSGDLVLKGGKLSPTRCSTCRCRVGDDLS